jgi:PAS domain S-box-containing protein
MGSKEFDIDHIRRAALDAVPQGVLITDSFEAGNPIIYANPAFERLTGYSFAEIEGRNSRFLSGPESSDATRADVRDALAARTPYQGLMLNYRKDGSTFWNDLTITPIDDGEKGRYFIGVQVDVTARLELEARLRDAQKMEALGKLSGGIAHDFNNLLALVLGNAELIADEAEEDSPIAEAIADIIEAADGGSKLVARMLEFARGQADGSQPIDVNHCVRNVVSLLSRTIGETIRVEADLSPGLASVCVDKTSFETALLNLALNARDALPRGGSITIITRRRADAGPGLEDAVVVSVADNGTGMDAATVKRAFEPFFTTKAAGSGTGLGLSMVYSLATQSGGLATIESAPGKGTTVSLLLPAEGSGKKPEASSIGALPRLIIVEDDAKVRKVLALHLSRTGYLVDEAGNAKEALALLRGRGDYALLISDIRLSEGPTGIDLVAAARAERPALPVILITGFAEELDDAPAHLEGVPILRKPFRTKDLLLAASRMIDAGCATF